uniref:Isopenicillin N synthase-like Fe(2+) 2OG dioxygenase domain-containing protein n=1 Tax=Leersia perrieri TaxID=77586 RepID=A0A0D9V793_9ORYZ
MTATSRAPRRLRVSRARAAPPPTPIRTARGARSAAADELVLAEFLEASLRVPDLALPSKTKHRSSFRYPALPPAPDVLARALLSGEAEAVGTVAAAAAESGAFRVVGAVEAGEVRAAVEAAEAVFRAPEEVKRELGRWFRRRDRVAGEEFYWFRPASSHADKVLDAVLPGKTYQVFREKMVIVALKMEDLAQCVMRVLSDNVKNPKHSALPTEAASILCLTQYNCNKLKTHLNEFGNTDPPNSYALGIHLSGRDQEICLRNQSGSTFFSLPACSVLVTIGKQIQEWSNGEFKNAVGEILFELTDEPNPFISLELLYSPGHLHLPDIGRHARCIDPPKTVSFRPPKTVSFRDQILVALVLLVFFYLFWR